MAGSIFLTLALVFSFFSLVMYYFSFRGYQNTLQLARIAYHGTAMMVLLASTFLFYIILTHQYQYKYVFSYSNSDLSLGYLISTFWAGQEGSFMLWLLFTSLIGVFLQSYTAKRGDLEFRVMMVYTLATTFLLVMVSPFMKNPFAYLWSEPVFVEMKKLNQAFLSLPFMQNFMFSDPESNESFVKVSEELYAAIQSAGYSFNDLVIFGKGLNPLLQNFWMQIHPPILFIGFSMSTVPFSFAIAALIKNDYKDWVKHSLPWTIAGAGILGLGIMLGGYWAYGILGWGGYWAWDPVENSSLVPWIVGVAAIHTLLVQRKSQKAGEEIGRFAKTNLILCIMVYVLVLYSTFLTRSGILGDASVHSFVDPGTIVYLYLIVFIGTFTLIGAGMIVYRWKYLNEHQVDDSSLLSRELALFTAAVALGASAIIVLVGTSAPIFGQSVETMFYNEMHVPLAIIIGLLNGFSLLVRWKNSSWQEIFKKSRFAIISSVVLTLLIVFVGGVYDIMMILLAFSSAFTLFVNAEIAYKIITGNFRMLGAYLAHMGFAIFLLGVIGSAAYSVEKNIDLVKGQPVQLFGYDMKFTGYNPIENNKKFAFNIELKKDEKVSKISPVMYISDFNNSLMREPDIISYFTKDFYVTPNGYDDGTQQPANGNSLKLTVEEETRLFGITIKYVEFIKPDMTSMMSGGDFQMGAKLQFTKDGKTITQNCIMQKDANGVHYIPAEIPEFGIRMELTKIDPANKNAEFNVINLNDNSAATSSGPKEVLSVTASIKPFVNLVWLGVFICVVGFFVATYRRLKESY